MDWLLTATWDWQEYHDNERLYKYVEFGKITEEQYQTIMKEG